MASYGPAFLDEIRAGVDLVELVGRFVTLRRAGANWKGLCPFHQEKTPSFMVNPQKRIFHCFGCGVGGDAFGFLMRQDRLTFPEAVRALARTAGVSLPEERGGEAAAAGREALFVAMERAARLYAEVLASRRGESARRYLEQRGIDPELARRFGLGVAPEGWEFIRGALAGDGVREDTLIAAGLLVPRPAGGGAYDRFRGRLLFPIRDLQGRVVAFGGRAFGDEQPKYLNSPETPIYSKGTLLYAADVARPTIQTRNRALIVEGYVDCLMAHQHGFTETVAALGTAFTATQLGLLRRYCDEVVTFFDADAAGEKAAARAEELLDPTPGGAAWAVNRSGTLEGAGPFRVKVALLPAGHDPDTFLRAHGAQAFAERIAAARGILSYALDRALADPEGATGPRAQASAFERAAVLLAKVSDAQEAAALSREAAARLGVDPTQLWIEAQRRQSFLRRAPTPARPPAAPVSPVDRDLVAVPLAVPDARPALLPLLDDEDLGAEPLRAIVGALRARPDADATTLMPDLPDEGVRGALSALLVEERDPADARASIPQFRQRLERRRRLKHVRDVSRRIAEAPAIDEAALDDALRIVERESRQIYEFSRAVGQVHPHGPTGPPGPSGPPDPSGPQGAQRHD
jgi:DNA primase